MRVLFIIIMSLGSSVLLGQSYEIKKWKVNDSTHLSNHLQKLRVELLTQSVIDKYMADTSFKTYTIVYATLPPTVTTKKIIDIINLPYVKHRVGILKVRTFWTCERQP